MPRFGKDKEKDSARKAELDRQAQEEVERLTRRAGPPGMGGGGMGGPGMPGMPGMGPIGMPSPLERIAAEVRDAPRPSMRKQQPPRRPAAPTPQAFTPLPSGSVGSSFGPGGLNPGPRMAAMAPPPPAFGGGAYDEDYGGPVAGPPVYNAEPDEDEEMTITEMALMDHAARTGHNPEDLVVQYDASSAEEMRDAAMRAFYERQQSRGPGVRTNNPFAPAGMRAGPAGPPTARQAPQNPAAAGGALAQRLANRRKREEEQARRAAAEAAPAAAPAAAPQRAPVRPAATRAEPEPVVEKAEPAENQGALARVLARRRAALGIDEPSAAAEPEPDDVEDVEDVEDEDTPAGLHPVPLEPVVDERAPSLEEMAAATRSPRKASPAKKTASKAGAAKKAPAAAKAPAAKKTKKAEGTLASTAAPATKKAPASKKKAAPPTPPAKKAPAKKTPAKKAAPGATSRAKAVFCIECGEKNPAIAKFCFNCGTRLAAPED